MSKNLLQQPDGRSHEELLQRFHDGSLTESEAGALLELWDENPECLREAGLVHSADKILRQMAFERCSLSPQQLDELKSSVRRHFGIVEPENPFFVSPLTFDFLPSLAREQDEPSMDMLTKQAIQAALDHEKTMASAEQRPHRTVVAKKHSAFPLLLILLFVLLFLPLTFYIEFFSEHFADPDAPPQVNPIARISGVSDVFVDENSVPVKLERRFLEEDRLELSSGKVEFLFDNNVRMVFEGPGSVKLISAMNVFCDRGRLSVTVPPEGKGFEIATPKLTVRDLGTEFVMDVAEDSTEVHVVRGEVEANWLTKDWMPIKQGGGVRTASGSMTRIAADRSLFVVPKMMQDWTRSFFERQEKTYNEQSNRWSNDPNARIFLDFESKTGYQSSGCRRVKGEWENSEALEFKRRGDVVRTSLESRPKSLTLMSTIKIDWTNRAANILFVWRGKDRGKILWKINNAGMAQLVIDDDPKTQPVSYDSPVAVSPQLYGVWLRLAVTVDTETKTVRHYLNGKMISEQPLTNAMNLDLYDIEIGNWTQKGGPTNSHLNGAMDDFLLYDGILENTKLLLQGTEP